ncbi:MAG: tRNA (adenosine(37)-N6)-dimethylallyltransferase MiaA [Aerococcus sp.]|nr:tRNA (adenosine(37)-N6)-dimethylallyltransferase MiaA [Aerococcus sp.]
MSLKKPKIIVIAGPTAVGKTVASITLAQHFTGEIVNVDSMQIYEGLTIGTASPTTDEKKTVPHHLFNYHSLTVSSTVSEFIPEARATISDTIARGKVPIVVGGSGLYLESLLFGFQLGYDAPHPDFRDKMQRLADEKGVEWLHQQLEQVDAPSAATIHPNNVRRVIRALEVATFTDHKLSDQTEDRHEHPAIYDYHLIVLNTDRHTLYERINRRVDMMIANGLLTEAEWLFEQELSPDHQSLQAIGYKELFPYFRDEKSLEECVKTLKTHSRHYAKRQLTWLRHRLPEGHQYDLVRHPEQRRAMIDAVHVFLEQEDNE